MELDGETRRCLLELVYDVLPEVEAVRLRERIDADPALAAAYADMQRNAELLRDAARVQMPRIELKLPPSPSAKGTVIVRSPARRRKLAKVAAARGRRRAPWTRVGNWIACLASTGLILCSLAGYWYHRSQLADISAEHLRLTVIGPAKLHPGVACQYAVITSAVTGEPVSSQVEFSLLSPDGQHLLMSHKEKTDENGDLLVTIPAQAQIATGSELKIVATHHDKVEQVNSRLVVESVPETTQLQLDKPWYRPGETVRYRSVTLSRLGWTADRPRPLHFVIHDPKGAVVAGSEANLVTQQGVGCGQCQIPPQAIAGQYILTVQSRDGAFAEQKQTFAVRTDPVPFPSRDKPAATSAAGPDEVVVTFYPEGGSLVAGLENRVYFLAQDAAGKPIHLVGHVEDGEGEDLAAVETTHEGMGVFSLTPRASDAYRLKIEVPAGVTVEPKLPEPVASPRVVLTTGSSVFGVGEPLEFNVRATELDLPLIVAAYCHGALVGHQAFAAERGANSAVIDLDETVSGAIRLCVFDYSDHPPRLIAERLVYRRPARQLNVALEKPSRPYRPGEKADVSLLVTDETGKPAQATLGVTVVEKAASDAGPDAADLTTAILLNSDLDRGQELLDTGRYLVDDSKAAAALDLLLATRGWRRVSDSGVVEKRKGGRTEKRPETTARTTELVPPAVFDNLLELRKQYQASLNAYRTNRTKTLSNLMALCFFGGAGLLLLATVFTLMNVSAGLWVWIPSGLAAATSLLIGVILISPNSLNPTTDGAVAFTPFHLETKAPAPAAPNPPAGQEATGVKPPADACTHQYDNAAAGSQKKPDPPATLYWHALLPTDAEGRVKFHFDVPQAAQSLQLRVDAHGAGRIGSQEIRLKLDK